MKRKLSICLMLAGLLTGGLAQETNLSALPGPAGGADPLAARRARIEDWRATIGVTNINLTNRAVFSNAADEPTNQLSRDERRARLKAKLDQWRESRVPTNPISALTNAPAEKSPGADTH